jgi:hypothetical protein
VKRKRKKRGERNGNGRKKGGREKENGRRVDAVEDEREKRERNGNERETGSRERERGREFRRRSCRRWEGVPEKKSPAVGGSTGEEFSGGGIGLKMIGKVLAVSAVEHTDLHGRYCFFLFCSSEIMHVSKNALLNQFLLI